MRIGVDASRLAGQRLGVGRYIEYLVKNWHAMVPSGDTVTLYTRHSVDATGLERSPGFRVQRLGPSLTGTLWQNLVLAREARNLDVLFCPSYAMPLRYRGPCVVAIHSMNEIQEGAHPHWYRLTYSQVYRLSAERAVRVIAPAEATRRDIAEHYGIPLEKIDVVAQGADDAFRPMEDDGIFRATRVKMLGADRPYILFVGKLSQRRNIPALMAAYAMLRRTRKIPHALLLVGPNHLGLPLARLAAELGIEDGLVQTDGRFASHSELVPIYNAADVFVHASSYEGFSMTTVEALACGAPVVSVRHPAMAELCKGAALLVDEPTPEALADALGRVVSDPALRADLARRSRERGPSFRWDTCARETLDVLRRVAEAPVGAHAAAPAVAAGTGGSP